MICHIHVKNEVWCIISGLSPDHLNFLYDTFAPYKDGYRYIPIYQLGRWDGRIRFVEKTGKTYTKLLFLIVPFIEKWGYNIDIIDDREYFPAPELIINNTPFPNQSWVLRPYQKQCINLCIENGNGFIICGTGGGKTSITAGISHAYSSAGYETITIVPSADLVEQTYDTYKAVGLEVGRYSGDHKDIRFPNVVATWQAIQYNPRLLEKFQCLIWDEAHGAKADVASKLLNESAAHIPFKFGVTGTFPKPQVDQYSLHGSVGDILIEIPTSWLMDHGYVTSVEIEQICLTQKDKQDFSDYAAERAFLSKNEHRMDVIADIVINKCNEFGNTLVLVNSIPFGEKLASMIDGAVFLYGVSSKDERKEQYEQYEEKDDIITIATTGIASTGISIDRIHCLILIDAGKSFIKTIQSIGRSLRLAKGKSKAYVVDIFANLKWSKKHAKEREKYYKEATYPISNKHNIKI